MSDDNEEELEEEFDLKKVKDDLVEPEEIDLLAEPLISDEVEEDESEEDSFSFYVNDDDDAEFSY